MYLYYMFVEWIEIIDLKKFQQLHLDNAQCMQCQQLHFKIGKVIFALIVFYEELES